MVTPYAGERDGNARDHHRGFGHPAEIRRDVDDIRHDQKAARAPQHPSRISPTDDAGEPQTGHQSEPCAHELNSGHERERKQSRPQRQITKRGSSDRVGRDARGVVIRGAGDEARAKIGEEASKRGWLEWAGRVGMRGHRATRVAQSPLRIVAPRRNKRSTGCSPRRAPISCGLPSNVSAEPWPPTPSRPGASRSECVPERARSPRRRARERRAPVSSMDKSAPAASCSSCALSVAAMASNEVSASTSWMRTSTRLGATSTSWVGTR